MKTDLRVAKTQRFLTEALMSLLKEKKFDEIKIYDICEKAMINRSTFYKHFEDKQHLLVFILTKFKEEIEKEITKGLDLSPKEYYCLIVKIILKFLYENKEKYKPIIINLKNTSNTTRYIIFESIFKNLKISLINHEKKGYKFDVPIDLLSNCYCNTFITIITWWFENDSNINDEEIFIYINKIINI